MRLEVELLQNTRAMLTRAIGYTGKLQAHNPGEFTALHGEAVKLLTRVNTLLGQETHQPGQTVTMCYVNEEGKPCEFRADTNCRRCHKPICEVKHTEYVENFFSESRVPYCPACYWKHQDETAY